MMKDMYQAKKQIKTESSSCKNSISEFSFVFFLDSLGFLCVNSLSRIHLFQALPGITLPFTLVLWLSGSGTQIGRQSVGTGMI